VRGIGVPPLAEILNKPARPPNTTAPSGPQAAPAKELGKVQSVRTGPPDAAIILRVFVTEKTSDRLSGDQYGVEAPSVPGNTWPSSESMERTQIRPVPNRVTTAARRRPSGETVGTDALPLAPMNVNVGGGVTRNRTAGGSARGARRAAKIPNAIAAIVTMAAAAKPAR
jgi:hypothetical protein